MGKKIATKSNAATKTEYDGKIVAFTPRGSDVELRGKVVSSYVSTLDQQTYVKIKAEDSRTYTKQVKYVEVLDGTPAAKDNAIPESLLREIKALSRPSRAEDIEPLVKRLVKKEFAKMFKALKQ